MWITTHASELDHLGDLKLRFTMFRKTNVEQFFFDFFSLLWFLKLWFVFVLIFIRMSAKRQGKISLDFCDSDLRLTLEKKRENSNAQKGRCTSGRDGRDQNFSGPSYFDAPWNESLMQLNTESTFKLWSYSTSGTSGNDQNCGHDWKAVKHKSIIGVVHWNEMSMKLSSN